MNTIQRYTQWAVTFALTAMLLSAGLAQAANSAVKPKPKKEDWWQARHKQMNERVSQGNADLLFIGDSITHGWEGKGKAIWDEYYAHRNAVNLGIGGDRTQHVLWRLQNGNIEGLSPKLAVVMIGTNNHGSNSAEEISEGITKIIRILRNELPDMKVLLLGIFPRADTPIEIQEKLTKTNSLIADLAADRMVQYFDMGRFFLDDAGALPKSVMPDLLHPNDVGYQMWAEAIEPRIADLLGEYKDNTPPTGYVQLFNGKDLAGWKGLVDDPEKRAAMTPEVLAERQKAADEEMRATWTIKDGVLNFTGEGHSLCTDRDYQDIDMLVDWKISPKGDSGIYLRGAPQVQIWDPAMWPQGSGGLYNNKNNPADPSRKADNPIGDWNRFRILMVGEKVTVYLNNELVVDNVVLENYWNREIPIYDSGQIELQNHGDPLSFRNVFVREIPRN
jgi:lysophospholipase L1-like esterase